MSTRNSRLLDIPESLWQRLMVFRSRLRVIKLTEAVTAAIILILIGYLLFFAIDRLPEPPRSVRWGLWGLSLVSLGLIPLAWKRWVWNYRKPGQLARLLSRKHPVIGDQLLGILELAENPDEQARSPELFHAAIQQVSSRAEQIDFQSAVPQPRHRTGLWTCGVIGAIVVTLLLVVNSAATNAWARFLAPWGKTPRYTFAMVEPVPARMIIPHGERVVLPIRLESRSVWQPAEGVLWLKGHPAQRVQLSDGEYRFELPGQVAPSELTFRIGDATGRVELDPQVRPELRELQARIVLPDYLERQEPVLKDLRGGTLVAVKGSSAVVTATVSRELSEAKIDQSLRPARGAEFTSPLLPVDDVSTLQLSWLDTWGLGPQEPYALSIEAIEDEAPSLVCENLPRQQVVLDSETVAFQIRARDDFGVKRVGIEWQGLDDRLLNPAKGEKLIGGGGSDVEFLELKGAFTATQLGITPQPVSLRVFVEDYLPGRERVYSPESVLYVLNAEQHAIWVAAQLGRWHQMALDVRDRELQLHETNQELRRLSAEDRNSFENRRRIEAQAAAEQANGRKLSNLIRSGEEILQQAMRNPEIGVGHLERWAEMMQVLKDIAGNRMPSVANLLKEAAEPHQLAQKTKSPLTAGENRSNVAGSKPQEDEQKNTASVPSISDVESSEGVKPAEELESSEGRKKDSQPRLTLPTTSLAGNGASTPKPPPSSEDALEDAVREQRDLLAEFEKIADELNAVLANLEGSTLVKRLKAAARRQFQVASKLGSLVPDSFGVPVKKRPDGESPFDGLAEIESSSSEAVSYIMDDMAAFLERSRFQRFKVVLDDMRKQDVTAELRNLSDDLTEESGLSISQAEYWGDTLDRWAEDLVEVTKSGACPGSKAKGSLPPSIVLEVLQILEGEVNLREETRVAQQARSVVAKDEHAKTAVGLSESQAALQERVEKVIFRIRELPDAETDFGNELKLLKQVSGVMLEATERLSGGETGVPAIAAETEAIELLLQSRRFNPNGGGGGGSNPGGGGGGTTQDSALALVGTGVNEKEVREEREAEQATGLSGQGLPEEFRAGLDEYFTRLGSRQP